MRKEHDLFILLFWSELSCISRGRVRARSLSTWRQGHFFLEGSTNTGCRRGRPETIWRKRQQRNGDDSSSKTFFFFLTTPTAKREKVRKGRRIYRMASSGNTLLRCQDECRNTPKKMEDSSFAYVYVHVICGWGRKRRQKIRRNGDHFDPSISDLHQKKSGFSTINFLFLPSE